MLLASSCARAPSLWPEGGGLLWSTEREQHDPDGFLSITHPAWEKQVSLHIFKEEKQSRENPRCPIIFNYYLRLELS